MKICESEKERRKGKQSKGKKEEEAFEWKNIGWTVKFIT